MSAPAMRRRGSAAGRHLQSRAAFARGEKAELGQLLQGCELEAAQLAGLARADPVGLGDDLRLENTCYLDHGFTP